MGRVLAVEDEEAIARLIAMAMKSEGHLCDIARDGLEAERMVNGRKYDLMILDVMLPGQDGFELFEKLDNPPPTLFVTARTAVEDRVRGLKMGAEDYLVKPFDVLELLARAGNILRRHAAKGPAVLTLGHTKIDRENRRTWVDGQEVELTRQEFSLLETLLDHPGRPLSRDQLLNDAWGYDYLGGTRTVDAHIQRIRKKLNLEDYIVTVHRIGYRLEKGEENG